MELMMTTALEQPSDADKARWEAADREWVLTFLRSPLQFLPDQSGDRVAGVRFAVNRLEVGSHHTLDLPQVQWLPPIVQIKKSLSHQNKMATIWTCKT